MAATAVVHGGQEWAGATGLTGMQMTYMCKDAVPCVRDGTDFYRMDPDGMHYSGGSYSTPGGDHYMMIFTGPEWLLKSPVMPGTMMEPELGIRAPRRGRQAWRVRTR